MSKVFVVSENGVLQGVFTQKKILWETLEFEKRDLSIAIKPDEFAPLTTCDKMSKYLTRRGMLQIYYTEEAKPEYCPDTRIKIWTVEPNTKYKLEKGDEHA